jgi:hypothetical protein
MVRRLAPIAAALSLVACSAPRADGSATPNPDASASSAPPAATSPPSTADQLARADACAAAALAVNPNDPRLKQMSTVVTGCMSVYTEQSCKDGLAAAIAEKTPDDQRIVVMSKGCGDAYCPRLMDEPRPKYCTLPDSTEPTERAKFFTELRNRILELELGEEGRARVDAAFKKAKEDQARAGQ